MLKNYTKRAIKSIQKYGEKTKEKLIIQKNANKNTYTYRNV